MNSDDTLGFAEEGPGIYFEADQALEVNDSAVDAVSVDKSRRRADEKRHQSQLFWKTCLSSKAGRAEIWELLKEAGTFSHPFACGPNGFPQTEATWFMAGKKEFGQSLYHKLIIHDRDGVWLMLDENDPAFAKPKRRIIKRGQDDND